MKNWLFLIFGILMSGWAYGQRPVSTIRFTTTDQHPITVILNNRDFNRVGKSITFKDLPKKRHHVQIYQVVNDSKTGNKRGIKLYSGNIKLEPGKQYDAILNMRNRTLRVKPVSSFAPLAGEHTNRTIPERKSSSGLTEVPVTTTDNNIEIPLSFEENLNSNYLTLKKEMDQETLDKDKMVIAKKFTETNSISAYEGRAILSWLLFEDSKVSFAKYLASQIVDKQNLDMLADAFSFEKSKEEYLSEIKK